MTLPTPFDVPQLLEDIQAYGADLSRDEVARQQCLAAARSLFYALETPHETLARLHYAELPHQAALRTGIELGLFKALSGGSGKPVQTSELSTSTGADVQLLGKQIEECRYMNLGHAITDFRHIGMKADC